MNTAKIYKDCDGNDLTIHQIVRRDPGWAACRIQEGELALEALAEIKTADIENFVECGEFLLPEFLREKIRLLLLQQKRDQQHRSKNGQQTNDRRILNADAETHSTPSAEPVA